MAGHNTAKPRLQMNIVGKMFTDEIFMVAINNKHHYRIYFSFLVEVIILHPRLSHIFLILLIDSISFG